MSGQGESFGKVILLGEHAVVFGHPALAAALPFGVRMEASAAAEGVRLEGDIPPDPRVAEAARAVAEVVGVRAARVRVESALPPGGGLGSSAAFAVALARALGGLRGGIDDHTVLRAAEVSELIFHGRPSGVDAATCAQRGVILFRRGEPPEVRTLRVPRAIPVVLGFTGKRRATSDKIATLASRVESFPEKYLPLVTRLGALAEQGARGVEASDHPGLGTLMNEAHDLLSLAELSSPELDAIVRVSREAGALGAKLTGAGGGGAALALSEDPEAVAQAIRRAGFEARTAYLGEML